ncbi:hypothetical protein V5T82_06420 [Magnetovibrio sp. PR-2]|uniref:hypothetical protein n=1 Tax=Magnetovibrio sp. PR-2 TaxID=3120356 RepID=UPI002FCE1B06
MSSFTDAVFKTIINRAEPFALDLDREPLAVTVRAQVILSFVAFALGKGGLFISSFLLAMAWLDRAYLPYGIGLLVITILVMVVGYIGAFGRLYARIDQDRSEVQLTKKIPFYRSQSVVKLSAYTGIIMGQAKDGMQTLVLTHTDETLNVPLLHRRMAEPPEQQAIAYAQVLGVSVLKPVEMKLSTS